MTGVYLPFRAPKRLELARELFPRATRFLVLADRYTVDQLRELKAAADQLRLQLTVVEFPKPPYEFAQAFDNGRRANTAALIGVASPVFTANRSMLA